MRKWYIITTIVLVGMVFAAAAFFFVSRAPAPDTTATAPRGGFVSFFGRQFGFGDEASDTPATTTGNVSEVRPTFRQRLAREKMIPVSREMVSGITFTASTTSLQATSASSSQTTSTSPSILKSSGLKGSVQAVSSTATTTIESVRFVLRETGHIEDMSLETGDTKRISNMTVPRIQEALFGANGSAVALRYLGDDSETIETFIAPLPTDPNASSTEIFGTFFQQNITSLAFSPEGDQVFYLTGSDSGATGRIGNLAGTFSRLVFFSPLTEWLANWEAPGVIDLATKPSSLAFGAGERVTENGNVTRTFSGTQGLTILPSPGGTRILFSQSDGSSTRIFMYDLSSRERKEFLVPTLPEKCVWADDARAICAVPTRMGGAMPDVWYQGVVSFADSFWMLDGVSGNVDFLFDPAQTPARETVDVTHLTLSYDDTVLAFINKKDLRGWVADLSEFNF